jgi:hypothetical protein
MSDRTRRRLTLTLFAVLCLMPTLVVAAWGVSRHLPGHVRAEAQRLGWQLGMKVSIGAVAHPRPGVVRYEGLVLANPETDAEIARCLILEATCAGPLLTLRAVQPEINAAALEEFRRLVDRVLAGRAGPLDGRICFAAETMVIRSDRGPQTFSEVEGVVETRPQGTLATVEFRFPGQSAPKTCLYVGRDRQQATPASFVKLDTEGNDLPCSVLALAADGQGPPTRGQFCGDIYGCETADGWDVQVHGQFDRSELERLLRPMRTAQSARLAFLPEAVGSRQ